MSVNPSIVKRVLITEKAVGQKESANRYLFEVPLKANKPAIRKAIEELFKVTVKDVHTLIARGKQRRIGRHTGRRPNWKKAIVTLKQGDKIPLLEAK